MDDPERLARASARRSHAILRKTNLGTEEVDLSPLRGAEAVSLVARLTKECWSLAGRQEPSYTRSDIPCRFVSGRLT